MNKKLQVFVSSTYLDLKDERQKAVEGILRAGHIPAGMELFIPANKSQWSIIEKWIEESDVLMLILGGKYGSIEPDSGKSYTQLEYEYALANNIPVFSVILNDQYLANKKSVNIGLKVYEYEIENPNIKKYDAFKKVVTSNFVSFVENINQISNEVTLALQEFMKNDETEYHFEGWVRGTEINHSNQVTQNTKLFQLDEELLNKVIETIEKESLIDTIENISSYCSYKSDARQGIDDFVYNYSQPSKRFFNEELQTVFRKLLKSLDEYTNYLVGNFFPKNERLYLYPNLNPDLNPWIEDKEIGKYEKKLRELYQNSRETIEEIKTFVYNSRITLYKQ